MDPTIVQRARIIIMQHRQLQGSGSPMRFQRMEVLQNAAVTLSGLLDDSKIVEYSSSSFHDGHTPFSFSEQYDFNRSAWFRTAHIPDGSYGCLCFSHFHKYSIARIVGQITNATKPRNMKSIATSCTVTGNDLLGD